MSDQPTDHKTGFTSIVLHSNNTGRSFYLTPDKVVGDGRIVLSFGDMHIAGLDEADLAALTRLCLAALGWKLHVEL